jgi:hypothetical protein
MATVNVQGVGTVNFPDSMSPDEIQRAIERDILPKPNGLTFAGRVEAEKSNFNPADPSVYPEASPLNNFLAGAGKGFTDLGRGIGQRLGLVDQASIDASRRADTPLMANRAGTVGNLAGQVAGTLPLMFVPGANTVAGSAAIAGLAGLAQPTAAGESATKNALVNAALGGAAQYGLGKLAGFAGNAVDAAQAAGAVKAAQNSVRDATLGGAQAAGYVVPPSMAGGGIGSRMLEGLSGKYKTNQLAAIKNQDVTNALAREALGLPDSAPLTSEAMQALRTKAFNEGYAPVANAGPMETDRLYMNALDALGSKYQGAARSFPNAVPSDVTDKLASLKTGVMDPGDALKMSQILRDQASAAYASGDKAMGAASKKAATAIEDQVERGLDAAGESGQGMLKAFRQARELMAKSHTVEDAIREGGGNVDAKVIARDFQAGSPLSGPLQTIGSFANNYGDVAGVPKSGWANPITVLDAFQTAGVGALHGGPLALALPAARVAARYGILSTPYQQAFLGAPSYGPGLLAQMTPKALAALEKRSAGSLLGPLIYAKQQ